MDEHTAAVLTKPLARVKFEYFRDKLGVVQIGVHREKSVEVLDGARPAFSMKRD